MEDLIDIYYLIHGINSFIGKLAQSSRSMVQPFHYQSITYSLSLLTVRGDMFVTRVRATLLSRSHRGLSLSRAGRAGFFDRLSATSL
jgi:hypothetical protein